MNEVTLIVLCLFAVVGAAYLIRAISDFVWTKRLLYFFGTYEDEGVESDYGDAARSDLAENLPLYTVLTVKLPLQEVSEADLQYLADYYSAMLSRSPLNELVSEIVFTE